MNKQVMGFGGRFKNHRENEIVDFVTINKRGHIGGLVNAYSFYDENNDMQALVTIDSKSSKVFPVPSRAKIVDFAEYNYSLALKGNEHIDDDDFLIETSFSTSTLHHNENTNDYGGFFVWVKEEIYIKRNSNFVTKRRHALTNNLNSIKITNNTNEEKTILINLYGYSTISHDGNNDKSEQQINIDFKEYQYINNQRYFYLDRDNVEHPHEVDESRPCYIQSMIIKGTEKDKVIDFKIKSNEIDTDNSSGVLVFGEYLTFENLDDFGGENNIFKITKYEEQENLYVMILKNGVYCPLGFKVNIGPNIKIEMSVVYFNEVE